MDLIKFLSVFAFLLFFVGCNNSIEIKQNKDEILLSNNNETLYFKWLAPDIFYLSINQKNDSLKIHKEFNVPKNRDFLPFKIDVSEYDKYVLIKSDSLVLKIRKSNLAFDVHFENQEFASNFIDRRELANLKFNKKNKNFIFENENDFVSFDSELLEDEFFNGVSSYVPNLFLSSNNFGIYDEGLNIIDNSTNSDKFLFVYGTSRFSILKRYLSVNNSSANRISNDAFDNILTKLDSSFYTLKPFINSLKIENNEIKLFPVFSLSSCFIDYKNIRHHYLIGDKILISNDENGCFLPKGKWYNFSTKELYNIEKGEYVSSENQSNIFVKSGAVLPLVDNFFSGDEILFLEAFVGFSYINKINEFEINDSSKVFNRNVLITSTPEILQVVLEKPEGNYLPDDKTLVLKILRPDKPKSLIGSYGRSVLPLNYFASIKSFSEAESGWYFDKKNGFIYIKSKLLSKDDTRFMALF